MIKHISRAIPLITLILLSVQMTEACTVFHASNENVAFGGNNEDWYDSDTYLYFIPPSDAEYGRVIVGYAGNYWIQGGMNEKGLFWDGLAAPYLEVVNSTGKPYFNGHIFDYILSVCDTCDEAIAILNQYNMKILERAQILMGDKYGNSFIIEGDIIHHKTGYFQVATNFYLSQWEPPYPCWRYTTAVTMLENNPMEALSADFCMTILDAVHQEGSYPTQYSTIYDLNQGLVYLYHNHDYSQVRLFNLTTEFSMGYHSYYIPELFDNENLPPLKPLYLSGPSSGKVLTEHSYSFKTYDPNEDSLFYLLDWGDGTDSGWLGPYGSGEVGTASHVWLNQGDYQIKVKGRDSYGEESEWSDPLPISMPKTFSFHDWLFTKILNVIEHLLGRRIV